MLQGVVDLFAETKDGLIVVDFKTDFITEETVEVKAQYYRAQVEAYSTALEQILAFQGYIVNYAIVTSENSPSLAFHEKLGYRAAGEFSGCAFKFGKRLGIVWMEKEIKKSGIPCKFPDIWPFVRQDAEKFSYILDILSLF